jgi:hypothetical protein
VAAAVADNLNTVGVPMYLAKLVMAVVFTPSFIAKAPGAIGNNLVKDALALTSDSQPEALTD